MKIGIVIPARLESTRLPNKILRDFFGMPMIEHVWRRAQLITPKIETIIATDNNEIIKVCEKFGATALKTSALHANGLSRVGEISKTLMWNYYIVLQADEILVEPENLERIHAKIKDNPEIPFFNLISNLENLYELDDVNIVKCQLHPNGTILNMMRKSSSVSPKEIKLQSTEKVCGIYGVSHNALQKLIQNGPTRFEKNESIEQMRAIEMGMNLLGVKITRNYPSVNTLEDAFQVETILIKDQLQKKIMKAINVR